MLRPTAIVYIQRYFIASTCTTPYVHIFCFLRKHARYNFIIIIMWCHILSEGQLSRTAIHICIVPFCSNLHTSLLQYCSPFMSFMCLSTWLLIFGCILVLPLTIFSNISLSDYLTKQLQLQLLKMKQHIKHMFV